MAFWVAFLYYIAVTIITELLRPEPDLENAKPATLGDFQFPTATEGRSVPVIWGTVRVNGPNIGWYGDLEARPIKKKVKTGMFSSSSVTVGHRYFIGLDFMICRGDMSTGTPDLDMGIKRIWIDDAILRPSSEGFTPTGTISFDKPYFFGGKDEGGVVGNMRIYPGSAGQGQDNYMSGLDEIDDTLLPNYRGTVHCVLEHMEMGNSARVGPWSFEVRRIPNGLGLAESDAVIRQAANPANVIHEIMTNAEWGLGLTNINTAQFIESAETLSAEKNGYGRIMDRPQKAKQVLSEIQQQIDGFVVQDPTTKQWELKLVRESDYPSPVTDIPLFDESNMKELEFTRGSWADTTNQVKIQFTDRDKEFKTTFAVAQDPANKIIQNDENVTSTMTMPGVQHRSLANDLAWRELRALSYPLAKGKIIADRSHIDLLPGDLARISWPPYNIVNLFVRINRIQLGDFSNNEMIFDWIEDIYRQELPSFADPTDTLWTEPTFLPANAAEIRIFPLPLNYSQDGTKQQYGLLVDKGNGLQTSYDIYYKEDNSLPIDTSRADTIILEPNVSPFTPTGRLEGPLSYDADSPATSYDNDSIVIGNFNDFEDFVSADLADLDVDLLVAQPPNLALIDDEIIFFESITDNADTTYTLTGVRRGMLDTAVAEHDDNSTVWFFTEGMAELDIAFSISTGGFAVWAMSNAGGGEQGDPNSSPTGSPEKGAVATQEFVSRYLAPGAPVNVQIDGERFHHTSIRGDSFYLSWKVRVPEFAARGSGKTQETANETGSSYTFNVRVYHTGVSPEVEVFNQTGIVADASSPLSLGTGVAVTGYAVPFSPDVSPWPSPQPFPQTYRLELEAVDGSPELTSQMLVYNFTRG